MGSRLGWAVKLNPWRSHDQVMVMMSPADLAESSARPELWSHRTGRSSMASYMLRVQRLRPGPLTQRKKRNTETSQLDTEFKLIE
jgi:hypothetical protein